MSAWSHVLRMTRGSAEKLGICVPQRANGRRRRLLFAQLAVRRRQHDLQRPGTEHWS
jgi:hypothetical protein